MFIYLRSPWGGALLPIGDVNVSRTSAKIAGVGSVSAGHDAFTKIKNGARRYWGHGDVQRRASEPLSTSNDVALNH